MPSKFDMSDDKLVRTDAERLADRRFDAYFAFETMTDAEFARRTSKEES